MSGYGGPDDDSTNAQAFVDNYIDLARSLLPSGESFLCCRECDVLIPEKRRQALKGVQRCVECQTKWEGTNKPKIKTVTYML